MVAELWFRVIKWFSQQTPQKAVIVLLSLIISYLLYENTKLHEVNQNNSDVYDARSNRNDSLISVANQRLQDCNDKRQEDLEKSNKYWSEKYEKLEEKLYEDYKTVKQLKTK